MAEDVAAEQRVRVQQTALVELLTRDRLDSLSLADAFALLARRVSEVAEVQRVSIWKLEESASRLSCLELYLAGQGRQPLAELSATAYPAYFQALAECRAIAAHDACNDPRTREFAADYLGPLGISSMLDATVRRGGRTVGIVCLEHVGPARRWSLDEQQFAATVADVVVMLLENDERRALQAHMHHQARHDELTGLPNLGHFRETVEALCSDPKGPYAMLQVDLERFGEINHALGHATGDLILREVANRIRAQLLPGASAARVSADKFVLWTPLPEPDAAWLLAQELRAQLREPLEINALRLSISARIGVSLFPDHGIEFGELLRLADMAMCQSRDLLHGCQIYDPAHDRSSARRLSLIHDLHGAVERGELRVVYQPRVRLPGGEIVGAEALVRWAHPQLGMISPAEFIPLAEMSDDIVKLTLAVIRMSAAAWHEWRDAGHVLGLSINLSASTIGDPSFTRAVLSQIAESGVPAEHVEFEITESAVSGDFERALQMIRMIRETGARISLDDFGVGHSSMSRLSRMPVDVLKIDQMFVQRMDRDPRHAAIVESSVQLARTLGINMVAEGVETSAIASALSAIGCSEAQGYYFSAPVAPDVLLKQLAGEALRA